MKVSRSVLSADQLKQWEENRVWYESLLHVGETFKVFSYFLIRLCKTEYIGIFIDRKGNINGSHGQKITWVTPKIINGQEYEYYQLISYNILKQKVNAVLYFKITTCSEPRSEVGEPFDRDLASKVKTIQDRQNSSVAWKSNYTRTWVPPLDFSLNFLLKYVYFWFTSIVTIAQYKTSRLGDTDIFRLI